MKDFIEEHLETLLKGVIVLLLLGIVVINLFNIKVDGKKDDESSEIAIAEETKEEPTTEETLKKEEENLEIKFYVDIKGAVKKPGVYEVSNKMIVNDVIKLAGGLNSSASTKYLNLSKKVSDQMVIYVYTNTEVKNLNITSNEECVCDNVDVIECEGASVVVPSESNNSSTSNNSSSVSKNDEATKNNEVTSNKVSGKVNINTATKTQLTSLNGIGESKAKAIIDYRNKNGKFKKIEDLKNVSGIGDSTYQKIKDSITV